LEGEIGFSGKGISGNQPAAILSEGKGGTAGFEIAVGGKNNEEPTPPNIMPS